MNPRVTLIDYTGKGREDEGVHAMDVLIFTKSTRLNMTPGGFEAVSALPLDIKLLELAAMAKTIPSSWEFVDLVFLIEGVTRACAQQITRTRTASYAMQSQRITRMNQASVTNPYEPGDALYGAFDTASDQALHAYDTMLAQGAEPQDARGLLPMNTQCNLLAKYNLRSFADLVRSRSSLRTQGEYAEIIRLAVNEVLDAWPWASAFFEAPQDIAIRELTEVAQELGVTPGTGAGWRIAKALDLIRKGE